MIDFSDKDKEIYGPFPTGQTGDGSLRYGDPLKIYRTLLFKCGGDIDQVLRDSKATQDVPGPDGQVLTLPDIEKNYLATSCLVEATMAAFELLPFDPTTGQGMKEAMCLKIFDTFMAWMNSFDEPAGSGPASLVYTDSLPATVG